MFSSSLKLTGLFRQAFLTAQHPLSLAPLSPIGPALAHWFIHYHKFSPRPLFVTTCWYSPDSWTVALCPRNLALWRWRLGWLWTLRSFCILCACAYWRPGVVWPTPTCGKVHPLYSLRSLVLGSLGPTLLSGSFLSLAPSFLLSQRHFLGILQ